MNPHSPLGVLYLPHGYHRRCFGCFCTVYKVVIAITIVLCLVVLGGCSSTNELEGKDAKQPVASDSPQADLIRRANIRKELAAGYLDQGKPEIALDEVNQALALDPRMTDALVLRGLIYFRMGDQVGVEQSYRRALMTDGLNGSAAHNLGLLLCQQRKFSEAQTFFKLALEAPKYKDQFVTWLTKGVCEARSGALLEAKDSLHNAFELDPVNPIAAFNLGKLYYQTKQYGRAQFYIARINATSLANAESLHLGVLIERRLDNTEKAKQLYDSLRARFPNSSQLARLDRGDTND